MPDRANSPSFPPGAVTRQQNPNRRVALHHSRPSALQSYQESVRPRRRLTTTIPGPVQSNYHPWTTTPLPIPQIVITPPPAEQIPVYAELYGFVPRRVDIGTSTNTTVSLQTSRTNRNRRRPNPFREQYRRVRAQYEHEQQHHLPPTPPLEDMDLADTIWRLCHGCRKLVLIDPNHERHGMQIACSNCWTELNMRVPPAAVDILGTESCLEGRRDRENAEEFERMLRGEKCDRRLCEISESVEWAREGVWWQRMVQTLRERVLYEGYESIGLG
ncbi:hypothetical protein K469DRAFT_684678 [Zopfia rhizophila CBS 207.26]|uniref:Uncharacterized protein n=1 Tax=Zopfia rhizophila CBS 207.26 TaxID=1314779 RepID=A0A6A6ED06_9PEZI|nr:hypothetical protein K469DRAFT_684678 [Zopfia rhizophila CBS 207.26]